MFGFVGFITGERTAGRAGQLELSRKGGQGNDVLGDFAGRTFVF